MAADNSNSTMEMGTSDQVLMASKKKKRTAYIAGGIVMVIVIALVITAVVLLTGNGDSDDDFENTTAGPSTITPIPEPTPPSSEELSQSSEEPPESSEEPPESSEEPPESSEEPPESSEEPPESSEEPPPESSEELPPESSEEPPESSEEPPESSEEPPESSEEPPESSEEPPESSEEPPPESSEELPPESSEEPPESSEEPPESSEEPPESSEEEPAAIDLDDLNSGRYSPTTFTASWVSGTEFMLLDDTANLQLHNALSGTAEVILSNSTEVLQRATRSVERSPDSTVVVVAHDALPVYRHTFLAHYTGVNLETGATAIIGPAGATEPALLQNYVWGPSGTSSAFVYLNNVYYKPNLAANAQQITTNGVVNVLYNGIPDWVYEEEVFSSAVALWFSPLGTNLCYATFDDTNVRIMNVPHYGVPGSLDDQYTRHSAIRYPKAGTTNPIVSVTIYNLATNTPTLISAPATLDQPILLSCKFVTETTVAVVWANRIQDQMQVDLCTQGGTCTTILSHTESEGWIENNPLIFNAAGTSFVTVLPQVVNGQPWKQVVQASQGVAGQPWDLQSRSNTPHTVTELLAWTDENVVWYKATAADDSAQQHLYSVNAAATVNCFTCNIQHSSGTSCLYNDAVLSVDNSIITITCAGPSVPEIYLYSADGTRLSVWEDNSVLADLVADTIMPVVTRLSVPVQEGLPNAEVLLQHPADIELRTNLPMLVYVYGGPDSAQVTHSHFVDWGSSLVSRNNIVVAHIDGRGSANKGTNNLFALKGRLGTIEVEDQITVARYLQQNLPYVDANRTCIWGWSYGGYASTLALVRGGDVFRCAMAVAPVTDWRYYDTIYTERYMDTPANNAVGYTASSLINLESANALRDKRYFLIHGTGDDNVHYQQSMLWSRVLQANDVYFNQMSYTDEDHGLVGVRPHLYHTLEKFLHDNMF